jgi:hypothetical protein
MSRRDRGKVMDKDRKCRMMAKCVVPGSKMLLKKKPKKLKQKPEKPQKIRGRSRSKRNYVARQSAPRQNYVQKQKVHEREIKMTKTKSQEA